MELCIDPNEDDSWRKDVVNDLADLLDFDQGWEEDLLQRTLRGSTVPFSNTEYDIECLLPTLNALAISLGLERQDVEVGEILDGLLDEEWAMDETMFRKEGDGVVFVGHMATLEEIARGQWQEEADRAVARSIKGESGGMLDGRRKLSKLEVPILPAKSTGTSMNSLFRPLPSLKDVSAKLPFLRIPETNEFVGRRSTELLLNQGFIATRDAVDILLKVLPTSNEIGLSDTGEGEGTAKGMRRTVEELICRTPRKMACLESPIFANRHDPAEISRIVFLQRAGNKTPPPEDSLESDAPFNALVEGIRQIDPLMELKEHEEHEGRDQRVPGLEKVLHGGLSLRDCTIAKFINRDLLTESLSSQEDRVHLQSIIEDCQSHQNAREVAGHWIQSEHEHDNAALGNTRGKRTRKITQIELPIFPSSCEPGVGSKRQKRDDSPSECFSAAMRAVLDATEKDIENSFNDEAEMEVDQEMEKLFDFNAASTNPIAAILDAEWDMASMRQLTAPTLPRPEPFHPSPDPWPNFKALLTERLNIRAFETLTSVEVALMHWNPVAAMQRIFSKQVVIERDRFVQDILKEGSEDAVTVDLDFGGIDVGRDTYRDMLPHHEKIEGDECIATIRSLGPRQCPEVLEDHPQVKSIDPLAWILSSVREISSTAVPGDGDSQGECINANDGGSSGTCFPLGAADPGDVIRSTPDKQKSVEILSPSMGLATVASSPTRTAHVPTIEPTTGVPLRTASVQADARLGIEDQDPSADVHALRQPFSVQSCLDEFMMLRNRQPAPSKPKPSQKAEKGTTTDSMPKPELAPPLTMPKITTWTIPAFDISSATRHVYIAGQRLLTNRALVRALENEFAVDLMERDLEFRGAGRGPNPVSRDVDLILDERTCVIYYPLNHLPLITTTLPPTAQGTALLTYLAKTDLGHLLLKSILRYSRIYVILEKEQSSTYVFTPPVVKGWNVLCGFCACLEGMGEVVRCCVSMNTRESAWIARNIGDTIAKSFLVPNVTTRPRCWSSKTVYETRTWLAKEESAQERFLSSFPPLNPFTSQIILTLMTLRECLGMGLEEMQEKVGIWVGERGVRLLYSLVHTCLDGGGIPEQEDEEDWV
ncbi:hypothetical protein SpCBS45565_g04702 [Spizellomyces sp. 'palustris']|nr:hypothetical protein SpCBS45565_g04702 [Spizellomyces sp. 'palustris']